MTLSKSRKENDKKIVRAIEHALTEGVLSTIPLMRQTDITRVLLRGYPYAADFGFSEANVTKYNRRVGAYISRVNPTILYDAYRELNLKKFMQIQTLCPWTGMLTYTKVYGNLWIVDKDRCDAVFTNRWKLTENLPNSLWRLHELLENQAENTFSAPK